MKKRPWWSALLVCAATFSFSGFSPGEAQAALRRYKVDVVDDGKVIHVKSQTEVDLKTGKPLTIKGAKPAPKATPKPAPKPQPTLKPARAEDRPFPDFSVEVPDPDVIRVYEEGVPIRSSVILSGVYSAEIHSEQIKPSAPSTDEEEYQSRYDIQALRGMVRVRAKVEKGVDPRKLRVKLPFTSVPTLEPGQVEGTHSILVYIEPCQGCGYLKKPKQFHWKVVRKKPEAKATQAPPPPPPPAPEPKPLPQLPVLRDPSLLTILQAFSQEMWTSLNGGFLTAGLFTLEGNSPVWQIDPNQGIFAQVKVDIGTGQSQNAQTFQVLSAKGIMGVQPKAGIGWQFSHFDAYNLPVATHRLVAIGGPNLRTNVGADPPLLHENALAGELSYELSAKSDWGFIKGIQPEVSLVWTDYPGVNVNVRVYYVVSNDVELGSGAGLQGKWLATTPPFTTAGPLVEPQVEIIGGRIGAFPISLKLGYNPIPGAGHAVVVTTGFRPFAPRVGE